MELESDSESRGTREDECWEFEGESEGSIDLGNESAHGHGPPDSHGSPHDGHESQDSRGPPDSLERDDGAGGFQLEDDDDVLESGLKLDGDSAPLVETFPPGQPLHEDCRALVCRVHAAVQMWSPKLLGSVRQEQSAWTHTSRACVRSLSSSIRVAASLVGLSPWRVFRLLQAGKERAQSHGEEPKQQSPEQLRASDVVPQSAETPEQRVLSTLTRCALGVRAMHGSADDYTAQVARLAVEGVNVGDKYHHGQHFKDVEFLASKVVQADDATAMCRRLPGLGIMSDFSILMDGIPLGGIKAHGRHGSVTVICMNLVSPFTQRLYSQLVSWCTPSAGHGGEEMSTAVLNA